MPLQAQGWSCSRPERAQAARRGRWARVGPTIPPHLGLPAYGPPVPLAVRQAGAAAGRLLSFMYIFADRRGEAPFLHCRPLSERERRRPTQAAMWVVALPRPHRSGRPTFRHCRGPGAGRSACRPESPRKRELQRPQRFELPSLFGLPPDDCIALSGRYPHRRAAWRQLWENIPIVAFSMRAPPPLNASTWGRTHRRWA